MDATGQIGGPNLMTRRALRRLGRAGVGAKAILRRAYWALWSRAARFRWILAPDSAKRSAGRSVARFALEAFLASPDRHYRRLFRTLDDRVVATDANDGGDKRDGTLLVIGSLGPGGAERQVVQTLKALKTHGIGNVAVACVHLLTPIDRFFVPDLEAVDIPAMQIGDETGALDPTVGALIGALPPELREVRAYVSTLSAGRPAVAHLWLDEVNVKGGIAAVLTGVPRIVLSQRSQPPIHFGLHQPYMREGYRWLARAPGVVMLNNSEVGARAYERWLGLSEGSIGVVRNGFSFDERELAAVRSRRGGYRKRCGIAPSAPVIGSILRFNEEKRPLLWLDIAARVRREIPESHFLIVGAGPLRDALERRAARPDLSGAVHFTGHLQDTLGAMADMDLFLLTSRVEGLPNVLVEAQFLGLPVVSTPAGGAGEAIDHTRSGWLLDNADPDAAAALIVALLRNSEWRKNAARLGPSFAFDRFHVDRATHETLAAYRGEIAVGGVERGARHRAAV